MGQDPSKLLGSSGYEFDASTLFESRREARVVAGDRVACRPRARTALVAAASRGGEGAAAARVAARPRNPERADDRTETVSVEVVEAAAAVAAAVETTRSTHLFSTISMPFSSIAVARGRRMSSTGCCAGSAAPSLSRWYFGALSSR